jgi:Protein of unknown function (DUF2442)
MNFIDETHPIEESEIIEITKAEYVGDFRLRLNFRGGRRRTVDFAPFLFHHPHPTIVKYQKPERFKKFKIVYGNLNWNNYEMIFPLEELYEGKIRV